MMVAGSSTALIKPEWPCPEHIHAFCTTRMGGTSEQNYASLNLAEHVFDDAAQVKANRNILQKKGVLPTKPLWLQQVHGHRVIHSDEWQVGIQADACITDQSNTVCTVLTADCLPVLFCNSQGTRVAAVHAGWRSLLSGILIETVEKLRNEVTDDWRVWLGPAISADVFEVGNEVRDAFCRQYKEADQVFKDSHRTGHSFMDMVKMAQLQLQSVGVNRFYGGQYCTYSDKERFFSHRRDGYAENNTGRMATLIWIAEQ